ncbi:hypothetical protein K490DRAFT_56226 [Saccharata proteae CBS 121410]|uniref:Uncharacterized protein n=1 Tax=Saccharata proteae CBS 121410 TaxID=1314787 RepID=A0A9P4M0T6_9PEZI|nr:hypothetical protein K490DRAFT_56226 [Saccharata proteae CBS 121410]
MPVPEHSLQLLRQLVRRILLQDNWAQFVTSAGNSYASFKCLQLGKRDVLPKEEELIDPIGHITVNNVEYAVGFKRSIPIQAQNPESIEPTPSISDSINPVPTSGYTHLPLPPNRPTPCIPYTDKLGYIQDTTQSTHPEFSRCPGGPNKPAAVPAHTIIPIGPYNLNGTCPTPTKSIAASTAKAPTRPFDDSTSSDWDFEYQQEPEDKTPLGNGTAPVAFVNLTNPPTDDEKAGYEDDAVAIAYTSPN